MSEQPDQPNETAGDFLARIGIDGNLWAQEFCKRFPTVEHEDAIGWFCNAIMAGWDASAARFGYRDPMSHPES